MGFCRVALRAATPLRNKDNGVIDNDVARSTQYARTVETGRVVSSKMETKNYLRN